MSEAHYLGELVTGGVIILACLVALGIALNGLTTLSHHFQSWRFRRENRKAAQK